MPRAKYPSLTSANLIRAGKSVLELDKKRELRVPRKYEKLIQYVLLGCLQTLRGKMETEYKTKLGLIDFWYHAAHQTLVELVTIRRRGYGVEHLAKRNVAELKKLSQFPYPRVITRYILILDFYHVQPLERGKLEDVYYEEWQKLEQTLRRQRKIRDMAPVTVVYVHRKAQFKFTLRNRKIR